MSWPTQEQFDAASAAGASAAQAEIANGATEARTGPLSGEWADDPTPRSVAYSVGWTTVDTDEEQEAVDELADAWEPGYFDAWAHSE